MSATMRAKFVVSGVVKNGETSEQVSMRAVSKSDGPYPADGADENNTYAKFSPSASLEIHIANPALLGKFEPNQCYYADFTPVA